MPDLAELEKQLEEAVAQRKDLQKLLDETDGWDDVPQDAVDEFLAGQ